MPCPFFSGFHDNVLQDFMVIAKKIESNFLNYYDFEYITHLKLISTSLQNWRKIRILTARWVQDWGK